MHNSEMSYVKIPLPVRIRLHGDKTARALGSCAANRDRAGTRERARTCAQQWLRLRSCLSLCLFMLVCVSEVGGGKCERGISTLWFWHRFERHESRMGGMRMRSLELIHRVLEFFEAKVLWHLCHRENETSCWQ